MRGLDDPLAQHVLHLEHAWVALARQRRQRPDRLVPDLFGRHRDQLALGIAQRGEPPAEDAAGVDAERVVLPDRVHHGRVAVDDRGPAAIVLRPRVPHGQPVLVGLAGGLAVQRELADPAGGPPLVRLLQAGVRDHQLAVVEHVVADQPVHELLGLLAELLRLPGELLQRLRQPVGELDVPAPERAHQLVLVVARHAERVAVGHHAHHQPEHAGGVRAAVDQVTDERRGPPLGVPGADRAAGIVVAQLIAELAEERAQLRRAAVDVTDDVERSGQLALVVVRPLVGDDRRVHLGRGVQHVHLAEAFLRQPAQRTPQLLALPPDHRGTERAVGPAGVALQAELLRHVQHDRDRQHVVLLGQVDQRATRVDLHVGRVHHREPAGGQPFTGDEVEHGEGVRRGGLVVLVVGHQPRQVSLESTWVAAKWRAANVDLPEPEAPTSTTSESSGIVRFIG